MCCKNNILITLAYYDVLDFPLKAEEVLRYLIKTETLLSPEEINIGNIKQTLDQLLLDKVVGFGGGYYFFHDRDYLIPLRKKRQKISERKIARATSAVRWLRFLPFMKTIFASGSLALKNCEELSDLDVLVVVKHGRIWLARLLISGVLSFLRIRRKSFEKIAPDKICLNHYITDKSLKIPFENLYNAQTYLNLKPILIRDEKIFSDFFNENAWLNKYLCSAGNNKFYDSMMYHKIGIGDKGQEVGIKWLAKAVSGFFEWALNSRLGNWLEQKSKNYQVKRIEANPLTIKPEGHVVYSDEQLAFHPGSVEKEIIEKYNQRLKNLGLGELTIKKNLGSFGA